MGCGFQRGLAYHQHLFDFITQSSSMTILRLTGGKIYDPANNIDGAVQDVWIKAGRIISPPEQGRADRTLDCTGMVVMPGGIDMHCHIAGAKVNGARRLSPERVVRDAKQLPAGGVVPTTTATGDLFASIGYTTAVDAACTPLLARQTQFEMAQIPCIDRATLVLMGNHHFIMEAIANKDPAAVDAFVAWLLEKTGGYGIKIVNPGGVEDFKQIHRTGWGDLDRKVATFGVTSRQIITELAASADRLNLPHAIHLHANNLGIPGNAETTLRTLEALEGRRVHLAHAQFHSYAGNPDEAGSFASGVEQLWEYVRDHDNVTLDVGHVMAGKTMSITGDVPFGWHLRQLAGGKWFSADIEMESSCGVIPIEYQPLKSLVHATQWCIAVEWYLRMLADPWRVALTSDHPNGGAFFHYPDLIAALMDLNRRDELLSQMPTAVKERTALHMMKEVYSLRDIAIITRAAPARILGLSQKGHLAVGADADVAVYQPANDIAEMFSRPRYVVHSGELIVEEGETVKRSAGRTFATTPDYDTGRLREIRNWVNENYSVQYGNFGLHTEEAEKFVVSC
jgi:formylmethanofuran dehydrogenase subunit A